MEYSSPAFIFFSVAAIYIYYFLKGQARLWVLLLASLLWSLSWNYEWTFLYLVILNSNFFALTKIELLKNRSRGYELLILSNALIYAVLKSDFILPEDFHHPYGLSFFMFMIFGLIIDQWRNLEERLPWLQFTLMPFYYPMLMAGPIERGRHFLSELNSKRNVREDLCDAVILMGLGLTKRFLLIDPLNSVFDRFLYTPPSLLSYIGVGFFGTFSIYMEFSTYALIGRGTAKAFGIDLPLSFRPIFWAKDPSDYWARWNITLGTWIRDYITFPSMFRFGRKIHPNFIILMSFIIVGLWHSMTPKWLIFGLFNGFMIVLHNVSSKKIKSSSLGKLLVLFIIIGNGLIVADVNFNVRFQLMEFHYLEGIYKYTFTLKALLFLIFTLLLEYVEEKKNDQDWFLKVPLKGKMVMSSLLIILYLWALEGDLLLRDGPQDVPLYFRI